ncbi:MAG: D-glycero-beta-D-manno-heptose 1-phosphate adenylyltransferase [Deltaproteobacteria bacterium]|nr:D-glycero-beta-D-manno-heptose 1-phosphate adenylyltransferase [Deltaproteobacteria bacterium]
MTTFSTSQKIATRGAATRWVRQVQAQGRKVVFTNGCFDLLHPGHIDYLEQARSLGDALVVGVNTDDSVTRLGKGPGRPVNPERDRARVLAALAGVDRVVLFDEDTPLELITALQPDVLVKGGDYQLEDIVGREVVLARGGQVLALPFVSGYSTSQLLDRIRGK